MKIFGFTFGKTKAANELPAPRQRKRIYTSIKKHRIYRTELEMDRLGSAVDYARDIERPNRDELYSIYDQIKKDRHLKSQMETAINDIQQSPFKIELDGNEDEELKGLFDAEWFDDTVEYAAEAEFYGHSLIEYPEVDEKQQFNACYLLPRENVDPALGEIILDKPGNVRMNYRDNLQTLNLVEIEGKEELGIFEYAAEEVILKKYARTDWSQASEKYGMPFLDYATDVTDKGELDKIAAMCAEFAACGFLVRGKDDVVEIKQAQNGDFYKIYLEAITLSNQEISKLINGQTATAENQAFVGTANVHERIMNKFTKSRLRRIQNHINGKLIPLMVKNNYAMADRLENAKFVYLDLLDQESTLNTDPNNDPNVDPNAPDPTAANTNARMSDSTLAGVKKKIPGSTRLVMAKKVDKLLEDWLKRFYDGQEGIDPVIWELNFKSLLAGIEDAGLSFEAKYKYKALAEELRVNAASFAAFKNHNEQQQLFDLLTDANGKPRSWNEFLKEAKPITQEYNQTWLETEYNQSVASAQMAEKWAGFAENADIYPNLEYRAVNDSQTRPEHAVLNGIVRPINDPFWNSNYPPNGWGCRCSVVQTDAEVTKTKDLTPQSGFDFNPGKDKKLFADSNGYQADVSKKDTASVDKQAGALLANYLKSS